jgi:hypothetical protein
MKIKGVKEAAKKAIEARKDTKEFLQNNVSFDQSLRLNAAGKQATKELFDSLYQGVSLYKQDQKLLDLEILVANLARVKHRSLSISLNRKSWKISRYGKASYFIIELVKVLERKNYIKMEKGFRFDHEPHNARMTRIWATEKLLKCLPEFPSAVIFDPKKELVELRDEKGKLKEYRDTAETRRIRKILQLANAVNCKADIRYGKRELNPCLMAIFREKFTLYGRLHTSGSRYHYQSFSEDERAEITIDGQPLIELDYAGLHPHLLYAKEKLQLSFDPYTFIDARADDENKDLRRFYKDALLSLINARTKWVDQIVTKTGQKRKGYWRTAEQNANSAITSLMNLDYYLPQEKKKKGLLITENDRKMMNQSKVAREYLQQAGFHNSQDIIDAFIKAHPKIAHYFFSGETGMRLMNLDSKIALSIIQHFSKQGIPILAVHDSFLVQEHYHDELMQVMQKIYREKTGGFSIKIK